MLKKCLYAGLVMILIMSANLFAESGEKTRLIPAETLSASGSQILTLREGTLLSEGFEATLESWAYIDNDGNGSSWGVYLEDGSYDPAYTGSYGAGVVYNATGNDDWLITPQLALPSNETATFSLWARSDGGYSTFESFKVMLSTTTTAISDFTNTLSTENDISVDWTQYTYDLTAYAGQNVHIALVCISVDQYYLWADDFLVISESIGAEITADFSADVTAGTIPLTVNFTDASVGSPTSWSWDFDNDGTVDATAQNPSYEYSAAGDYTVSLTVSDGSTNSTETKVAYINASESTTPGDDPDGWFLQNPYPTANWLSSVFSLADNTTFCVGDGGMILKTEDDGASWSTILSTIQVALKDIYFPTATTGYIVGDNPGYGEAGVVLKTVDSGNSWTALTSNINYQLNGVFFTDANTGWIIGDAGYGSDGSISKTTDGGLTWTAQNSGIDEELFSVHFVDANTGWIGGDRYCAKTVDGGTTWTPVDVTEADYNAIHDMHFLNANNGWVTAGYQSLYQTTDGGSSWTQVIPYGGELFRNVYFIDSNNGWASTSEVVYQTTDGGSTWTEQIDLGSSVDFINSMVFSSTNGYLVAGNGNIYAYSGGNWIEKSSSIMSDNINDVFFIDENHGWIVGWMDDIWATSDGGETWTSQATDAHYSLSGIDFVDANTGWAVGDGAYGADVKIYSTTNGGASWDQQASGTSNTLWDVDFIDANNGWAVGYQGTILNTSDGGANWILQSSNTNDQLYSLFMLNASTGWICGGSGSVLKTTDGGSTWTAHNIDITQSLSSIFFLNADHGFSTSSDKGYIFETTDGGVNWTSIAGGSYADPALRQIHFVDDLNGWIVGNTGTIFVTEDGGSTWEQQANSVGVDLEAVCFVDANTGWAVGDNGLIIKTSSGGASIVGIDNADISILSPESCTLNQNYPNPFNPSTTIQYALSEAGQTSLLIYDIRGNLIKTLVSESQSAGRYASSWDGMDNAGQPVATGLYLASLRLGTTTQTIKMLFLK